jgi:DNA-binding SARP family transcriptional activator
VEIPASAFHGRLVRTLLRVLVTRRGQFVPRDVLTEALWPQGAPADPALNLNVLVTRARQGLGDPSLIVTGPGGYSFAETPACTVDADRFLELVAAGRAREALDLWGGEPLAEDAYQDWSAEFRRRLGQAHLEALEAAATEALAAGEPARALRWARVAVGEEPLREAGHLLLARALAVSRDTAGALAALAQLRRTLADELGLDPSPEAEALERSILRGEDLARLAHPRRVPATRAGELPFVGRQAELDRILAFSEAIVVVAGPSGSGKSRLLSELAARSGRPVIVARAAPSERDEPWQLARSLVRSALELRPGAIETLPPRTLEALADAMPELGPTAGSPGSGLDVETRRALVREGAARLIEAAGEGGIVAADDLQWADASSLAVLERLGATAPDVQVVLALRPEELHPESPAAAFTERLGALGRPLTRVDLTPLEETDLGAIADPALVACLLEEADAWPMTVAQLLRELATMGAIHRGPDGRWAAASEPAYGLVRGAARRGRRTAIQAQVDRQPLRRRELLFLLSLLGRPAPARLLATAAGTEPQRVLGALDALGRADLIRAGQAGWTVAHDLIAEVVTEGLTATAQARLHELLGAALSAEGADPAEVARHLAGAGDRAAAGRAYAEAAAARLARFAHREAEQVAEDGLALGPSGETASSLLEVRAEARALRGELTGAREDLRAALAGTGPGGRRAHLFARMALLASGAEDLSRAAELAELAMAEAGTDAGARGEALWVAAIIDMNSDRQEHRPTGRRRPWSCSVGPATPGESRTSSTPVRWRRSWRGGSARRWGPSTGWPACSWTPGT